MEYSLKNQGLVVVVGRNGNGKSSLFIEAIVWLLHGRSVEYGAKPGADILNRHMSKPKARVVGIIEAGDFTYRVTRTRTKSEGTLVVEVGADNEWRNISNTTTTSTQDLLDAIWGMDYQTTINSMIFTGEVMRYPDFPDKEKKNVIDKLLGIGSVSEAYEKVSAKLTETKEQLVFEKGSLRSLGDQLQSASDAVKTARSRFDAFEEKHTSAREGAAKQKAEFERVLETIPKRVRKLQVLLEGLHNERTKTKPALDRAVQSEQTLKTSCASLEATLRERTAVIAKKTELIRGGKCPTCAQHTEHLGSDIPGLQTKADAVRETLEQVRTQLGKARDGRIKKEDVDKRVSDAISKTDQLWRNIREEESRARAGILACERAEAETVNPHAATIQSKEQEVGTLSAALSEKDGSVAKIEAQVADLEVIQKAFGNRGIRSLMVMSAIPAIEAHLSSILSMIGSPLRVGLIVRPNGDLDVEVDNPHGANKYHGCSSGERRIIDLAILFSFIELRASTTGGHPPHLIFDEAFEKVDDGWQEALASLLKRFVDGGSSVFFISHASSRMEGMADQVWRVEKGAISVT